MPSMQTAISVASYRTQKKFHQKNLTIVENQTCKLKALALNCTNRVCAHVTLVLLQARCVYMLYTEQCYSYTTATSQSSFHCTG